MSKDRKGHDWPTWQLLQYMDQIQHDEMRGEHETESEQESESEIVNISKDRKGHD